MAQIKWRKKVKNAESQQDLKRRAVLDAAASFFSTKGYGQTSIDDLAGALNVTKPALYYYVKNKEDILVQCMGISLEYVSECYDIANRDGATGLDKLRIFSRHYAENAVGRYGYALAREAIHYLRGDQHEVLRDALRSGQTMLENILREGMEDGSLAPRDTKYVGRLLLSALNQMHMWFDPAGPLTPGDVADRFLEPLILGLGGGQSDAPPSRTGAAAVAPVGAQADQG